MRQLLKFGDKAIEMGDKYTAIDYYSAYVKKDSTDYDKLLLLANLNYDIRHYDKAGALYEKIYKNSPDEHIIALYKLAQVLKNKGLYKEAQTKLIKFKNNYKGWDYSRRNLEDEIEMLDNTIQNVNNPVDVKITRLNNSINKPHIEFAPLLISQDTLLFGSLRSDSVPVFSTETDNPEIPLRRFYYAERTNNDVWEFKGKFNQIFNPPDGSTGNGAFSPEGNEFYFSKCKRNWNNKMICHLYVSKKKKGKWMAPEKLPYPVNIENYSSTQPTVGTVTKYHKERTILYFVSDRRMRSVGGKDIWYSIKDPRFQEFRRVSNLGSRYVNTKGNEITPYFDETSKTLYYSSDYQSPYGGYDIYSIRGNERRWKKKKCLGYPINTGADELYYSLNPNQKEEAFFTSNRIGGRELLHPTCCDDIYSLINKEYISINIKGTIYEVPPLANYLSKDTTNKTPLPKAQAEVYMLSDTTMEYIYSATSDTFGHYSVLLEASKKYRLLIKKDGYFYEQIDVTTMKDEKSDTIRKDAYLVKIPKDPIIFNIYYEFDSAGLTQKAKDKIDTTIYEILTETPDIIVEISSHTDSKGSEKYNENLSQRRAQSVVNYLKNKGIEEGRLIAKGYGESEPIANNETEKGRAKNRRTAFEVIGSTNPYSKLNIGKIKIIRDKELLEKEYPELYKNKKNKK